jgi:hypothetical protein
VELAELKQLEARLVKPSRLLRWELDQVIAQLLRLWEELGRHATTRTDHTCLGPWVGVRPASTAAKVRRSHTRISSCHPFAGALKCI